MATLAEEIREAEAKVAHLKSLTGAVTCAEMGEHDWRHIGGRSCDCDDGCCSVPVYECARCKNCDYGDNAEADEVKLECARASAWNEPTREIFTPPQSPTDPAQGEHHG